MKKIMPILGLAMILVGLVQPIANVPESPQVSAQIVRTVEKEQKQPEKKEQQTVVAPETPVEAPQTPSVPEPVQTTTPEPEPVQTPVVSVGTTSEEWMHNSNISPSDYDYAAYIIGRESSWRPQQWNDGGSGAYGLCQSLPASKMATAGGDYMTNPVTQLNWCDSYAKSRYGGWEQAYYYWISNHLW